MSDETQVQESAAEEEALPSLLLSRLARLGIDEWDQVLLCVPKGYSDFSDIKTLREALPRGGLITEPALFSLVVSERPVIVSQPKKRIVFSATDGMLSVKVVVFAGAASEFGYWKELQAGDRINIRAELQSWGGKLQITGPERVPDDLVGKIFTRYEKRRGVITEQAIFQATRYALLNHVHDSVAAIVRSLPGLDEAKVIDGARLTYPSLFQLLQDLHQPPDIDVAMQAATEIRKLAAFSVVFNARRMKNRNQVPDSSLNIAQENIQSLIGKLSVSLTGDQLQVINEVSKDLNSGYPMCRLLSGDVGTGKTLAYAIPAIAARNAGHLVAILTPNAVLAEQFQTEIHAFFGVDIPVTVVTGSSKRQLDLTSNPVVVGTTALLSRLKNQGAKLAFLVIDEQQKFSVGQKSVIVHDGTNLLEVTATAIPRTTALVTHGGMDVSILRECPVAKNIQTRIVTAKDAERLFAHTVKVLKAGAQVAVIYPLVDDPEQEKRSVVGAYETWSRKFPDRVGMVYGAMKEEEKNEVIRKIKSGELSILVSSTVIEIGVTIPALKSLIVVNAERYGVSTLHQLRGRVARHGGSGYFFIYLPDKIKSDTLARLQLLEKFRDGFTLAEHDAEMRGYGDLTASGERQHGASRSSVFYCVELQPDDIHQYSGDLGE